MKKSFRILSGLLCLALLSGALAPSALAEGTVTKEESVYITLTPEGQIKTQTVSEWLHSDTGLRPQHPHRHHQPERGGNAPAGKRLPLLGQ